MVSITKSKLNLLDGTGHGIKLVLHGLYVNCIGLVDRLDGTVYVEFADVITSNHQEDPDGQTKKTVDRLTVVSGEAVETGSFGVCSIFGKRSHLSS